MMQASLRINDRGKAKYGDVLYIRLSRIVTRADGSSAIRELGGGEAEQNNVVNRIGGEVEKNNGR